MTPDQKLHRVYVTVSVPLALDVHAVDGEGAWDLTQSPQNRLTIAQRLQHVDATDLAIVMELKGFVEELDPGTALTPPAGTIYATNEDAGGRVITPGTEGWDRWAGGAG